jgi:hypothetical protein
LRCVLVAFLHQVLSPTNLFLPQIPPCRHPPSSLLPIHRLHLRPFLRTPHFRTSASASFETLPSCSPPCSPPHSPSPISSSPSPPTPASFPVSRISAPRSLERPELFARLRSVRRETRCWLSRTVRTRRRSLSSSGEVTRWCVFFLFTHLRTLFSFDPTREKGDRN